MIVLSKQKYEKGETPVFLAFLDDADGLPIDPNDYMAIVMSHGKVLRTFSSEEVVPREGLDEVSIPMEALLVAPVNSPQAFEGTNTEPFDYNFIFLPGHTGYNFYDGIGRYRTRFRFVRTDGTTETIVFESECIEQFFVATIIFGNRPHFTATIRTKAISDTGTVSFEDGRIAQITRTVIANGTIVSDTEIPLDCLSTALTNNFTHKPTANIFPEIGHYVVRFTFRHIDGSPVGVAEIPVKVV